MAPKSGSEADLDSGVGTSSQTSGRLLRNSFDFFGALSSRLFSVSGFDRRSRAPWLEVFGFGRGSPPLVVEHVFRPSERGQKVTSILAPEHDLKPQPVFCANFLTFLLFSFRGCFPAQVWRLEGLRVARKSAQAALLDLIGSQDQLMRPVQCTALPRPLSGPVLAVFQGQWYQLQVWASASAGGPHRCHCDQCGKCCGRARSLV